MGFAPLDFNPQFGSTPPALGFPSTDLIGTIDAGSQAIAKAKSLVDTGGIAPASNFPAATTVGTPAVPAKGASTTSTLADYFSRAVVIVLGFIFVAAGLVMFKPVAGVVQRITPGT